MGGGKFLDFLGGHSCYEGDIELMGSPPSSPPHTRENPAHRTKFMWQDVNAISITEVHM